MKKNIFQLIILLSTYWLLDSIFAQVGLQQKNIQINSLQQIVRDKNLIIFEGEVEVVFDSTFHVWADRVEVDYAAKLLRATCHESCAVKVETKDIIFLATSFEVNMDTRIGKAQDMCIHTADGYFSAGSVEKIGDYCWTMRDISYTACDADPAHWKITAREASAYGGYFIKINWVVCRLGVLPVMVVPKVVIPIQKGFTTKRKGAHSGFLVPKFYLDYDSGFGFKQEYYQHFGDRCDTTLGVDWRQQKGLAFFDEFRWARSSDNFTTAKGYYALARHDFKERDGKIVPAIRSRYWVSGKDFFSYDLFGGAGNNLMCADFGTDKRIGYQFFDLLEQVDDTFYNAWINRLQWPKSTIQLKIDDMQTRRKRFSSLSSDDIRLSPVLQHCFDQQPSKLPKEFNVKELENRVGVALVPALSLHNACKAIANTVFYRHDLFFDQALYREQELVKLYCNSRLVDEIQSIPFNKAQVVRFDYRGSVESSFSWLGNTVKGGAYPALQARSLIQHNDVQQEAVYEQSIFAHGGGRIFCGYGAEWSLPEIAYYDVANNYMYALQPMISWHYVPWFRQGHWYFMDARDYIFPKNQLECSLKHYLSKGSLTAEFELSQSYEGNHNRDILPARRSLGDNHFLPLQVRANLQNGFLQGSVQQEYDVKNARLLNAEIITGISYRGVQLNMGYMFQPRILQATRELFSNISHFMLIDFIMPIRDFCTLQYAGQFYVERGYRFMDLAGIKPLLHTVRIEVTGHCAGFYIGYEEKKYREFGHDKHERAIVFSLRVNSLGSLAKRFKRPYIMDNSKINDEGLYGLT